MIRVGYACNNLTLGLTTNGTTRLGLIADREKWLGPCRRNLEALEGILTFNAEHGLNFRIGSSMVPFASHSSLLHLWREELGPELRRIGDVARASGIRLTLHPGQYCIPGSPRPEVVESALAELRYGAALLDLLGTEDGVIVCHLGGGYEGFEATRKRTVAHLSGETDVLRYLAFEHDDRIWPPHEVLPACDSLGIPIIVDNLHYDLLPGKMGWQSLLFEAIARWRGRRPKFHLSSQASAKRPGAHSDTIAESDLRRYVETVPDTHYDLMVEAKEKDRAALDVQEMLQKLGVAVRGPVVC